MKIEYASGGGNVKNIINILKDMRKHYNHRKMEHNKKGMLKGSPPQKREDES